jgi:hypothetical protein
MPDFSFTQEQADDLERAVGHLLEARERDHSFASTGSPFHAKTGRKLADAVALRRELCGQMYGHSEEEAA